MHIHILGICGTFMGSLALLAREMGIQVSGSDENVYPPMSTQLADAGIALNEGYDPLALEQLAPDLVVIGNAMSRGNAAVEAVLDSGMPYQSGPQWLAENVLRDKWVLAVSGTHGKTTTASMLAHILDYAGESPGFLIGGVPGNFGISARLGSGRHFVIEADEYDTAFFDKRSKFLHYHPRTLVMNNLEFDHADIFEDLAAIQKQFHHLLRTVPSSGKVILPTASPALQQVVDMGCWSELEFLPALPGDLGGNKSRAAPSSDWCVEQSNEDQSTFVVCRQDKRDEESQRAGIRWSLAGLHNQANAVAALAAASAAGVKPKISGEALNSFAGVKRRMELLAEVGGVEVYDDFAHHPTAIATTLAGARKRMQRDGRAGSLLAVIEPRSNTMRMGVHNHVLAGAVAEADRVWWYEDPSQAGGLQQVLSCSDSATVMDDTRAIAHQVSHAAAEGDCIVIMSNGGFGGIHQQIISQLHNR